MRNGQGYATRTLRAPLRADLPHVNTPCDNSVVLILRPVQRLLLEGAIQPFEVVP
jgi:hypothetical protein